MQRLIVKFYYYVLQILLNMFRALLCPSSGARQTAVAASGFSMDVEVEVFSTGVGLLVTNRLTDWPRLRTLPPPHPYGNQRLQRQFDVLLMMGIIMSETCWAATVWQSNKILLLIVASSWVFYLSDVYLFVVCFLCVLHWFCLTSPSGHVWRNILSWPMFPHSRLLNTGKLHFKLFKHSCGWTCLYFCYRNFNPLKKKCRPLYLKAQSVPRCKHFSSWL
jgi:hypothetical protein